ncbi:MAG: hypothetical protein AB1490_05700 [Pseudomonadota bacterium]
MKTLMIALTSLTVMVTSNAFAQGNGDACHSAMIPCLDMCTQRPSKGLQESCSKTCEMNANACYSQMYGTAGRSATPQDALNSGAADTAPRKSKGTR